MCLQGIDEFKKFSNLIGTRIRDLAACSIAPGPLCYLVPCNFKIMNYKLLTRLSTYSLYKSNKMSNFKQFSVASDTVFTICLPENNNAKLLSLLFAVYVQLHLMFTIFLYFIIHYMFRPNLPISGAQIVYLRNLLFCCLCYAFRSHIRTKHVVYVIVRRRSCVTIIQSCTYKQISWPESASEVYQPSDRRLSTKLLET
jgi:hypothetical protein